MPDKDIRNFDPQTGKGRTTQEIVDDAAGGASSNAARPAPANVHPAATPRVPANTRPVAPGVYGAPVGKPILSGGQ
jgi:hypothetical protein